MKITARFEPLRENERYDLAARMTPLPVGEGLDIALTSPSSNLRNASSAVDARSQYASPRCHSRHQSRLPRSEDGCRERTLSLITPEFIELAQTARSRSSSGDPLQKHLDSQNL